MASEATVAPQGIEGAVGPEHAAPQAEEQPAAAPSAPKAHKTRKSKADSLPYLRLPDALAKEAADVAAVTPGGEATVLAILADQVGSTFGGTVRKTVIAGLSERIGAV